MVMAVVTVATAEDRVMVEDRVAATVVEMAITTTTMAMVETLAAVSPWPHHKRQHQLLVSGWLHKL